MKAAIFLSCMPAAAARSSLQMFIVYEQAICSGCRGDDVVGNSLTRCDEARVAETELSTIDTLPHRFRISREYRTIPVPLAL
jgi:hypothetical protein